MSEHEGRRAGLWPRSLLGQMLLAVALALLVAQGISAFLLVRAADARRETAALNGLTFQLVAEPRFDFRERDKRPGNEGRQRWQQLRVERTAAYPLRAGERRETGREAALREILVEQGLDPARLVVTTRKWTDDPYVMGRIRERYGEGELPEWVQSDMLLAGLQRPGESQWVVARTSLAAREPRQVGLLIGQTVLLYILLVGGLAWLLRRITRPLAALRARLETFGETRDADDQLEPSGPDDTRRLIAAHNAMEARIVALLNEKDVMLGAIGHDLKTPLAALRVRAEKVADEDERAKMAATIDEISRALDDILSLARVGRPSDPLERIELAALVAHLAEEYEDMGDEVVLGDTRRIVVDARATWLRRALRNLIGNALRYGGRAEVSLVEEGGDAVIRIADNGPGIPEEDLERMLEPFTRGDPSRNRATGGAGLGLTLARAIAEQHGGSLKLANRRDGPDGGPVTGLVAELRLPTGN